eukprot:TRINITY_DN19264_c1_g1_i3.p1 TRINITY_DN19264_c1_g1~~TRINITY_DN19264_c1_g1_i3.p1  ORF type:complete len:1069 (+),score=163.90 TRINITY_DN19264_c1_g1_i3:208-3414(+)
MASLVVGGALGAKALFKYNRKNFFLDKKLKQEREFQEQDMRMEQFALYREDVRDLVELTVSKMDLYLIASALLLDKTVVMICRQQEALPPGSPEWAVALNAMSLASSVFYLLLCLWLAMYASVSAQSFGTRLLTQFVRLPYASPEQIQQASASGTDFESASVREMLRIPVLQPDGPGTRKGDASADPTSPTGASSSSRPLPMRRPNALGPDSSATPAPATSEEPLTPEALAGTSFGVVADPAGAPAAAAATTTASTTADGSVDPIDPGRLLPTAMLNHIRLYRRVQLNWQAYDAYARVSLFVGANSMLYSCLYWSLGSFLISQHAFLPAIGVALIVATIQLMLSRLDLRLRQREVVKTGALLATTPLLTTIGMLLHQNIKYKEAHAPKGHTAPGVAWETLAMNLCAVLTHVLHSVVVGLLCLASRPDNASGEALLPGKFRSTLYLDVFGWLLNPQGPGAEQADADMESDEDEPVDDVHAAASQALAVAANPSSRANRRDHSFRPDLRNEAVRLLHPSGGSSAVTLDNSPRRNTSRMSMNSSSPRNRSSTGAGTASSSHLHIPATENSRRSSRGSRRPSQAGAVQRSAADEGELHRRHSRSSRVLTTAQRSSTTQELTFGGREAAAQEVMEYINAPDQVNPTTFAPSRPRRVHHRTKPPGETPWRAFSHGSFVIFSLWVCSTVWAFLKMVDGVGWRSLHRRHDDMQLPHGDDTLPEFVTSALQIACDADHHPTFRSNASSAVVGGSMVASSVGSESSHRWPLARVAQRGCQLHRPAVDVSISCGSNVQLKSRKCLLASLRPGGRAVDLCWLWRGDADKASRESGVRKRRILATGAIETLRLAPGASALRSISIGALAASDQDALQPREMLKALQFIARSADGALLLFQRSGRSLLPVLEVESAQSTPRLPPTDPREAPSGLFQGQAKKPTLERLALAGQVLLAWTRPAVSQESSSRVGDFVCTSRSSGDCDTQQQEDIELEDGEGASLRARAATQQQRPSLLLRAWDLRSGERLEQRQVPVHRWPRPEAARSFSTLRRDGDDLCAAARAATTAAAAADVSQVAAVSRTH